jgi:DNA topoisomerase-1
VKKLEELGIGRPSTYAPTISTIQQREYVEKGDGRGYERSYITLTLDKGKITSRTKTETTGAEKGKLLPTDIGTVVNDFLIEHFANILDYNFTAKVEDKFDEIAEGKLPWQQEMHEFYDSFHPEVDKAMNMRMEHKAGQRLLGTDPKTGHPVYVKIGRFGPLVQIGEGDAEEKPQFASLQKGQSMNTITLEEALKLFEFPRILGDYEGKEVSVAIGRFGPYVKHDGKFASIPKTIAPAELSLDEAIELIDEKRNAESKKTVKEFDNDPEMHILNGRYGVYISYKKSNYKIPKTVTEPAELTYEQCLEIVNSDEAKPKKATSRRKK